MDDVIDLTSIQYEKPKETKSNNNTPVFDFNVNSIIKNAMDSSVDLPLALPTTKVHKPVNKDKDEDTSIDRRRSIMVLQFYMLEFPDKLDAFKGTKFEKLSDDELKKLKSEFDFIIGAKCNVKSTQYAFIQGIQLLETLCTNFTPMRINGLTNAINDDEFQDDCKHLALKYMTLLKTEPEHRIAYKILTTALLLHQVNSSKSNFSIDNKDDILNKINARFDDL
jgi:hypothetical protein